MRGSPWRAAAFVTQSIFQAQVYTGWGPMPIRRWRWRMLGVRPGRRRKSLGRAWVSPPCTTEVGLPVHPTVTFSFPIGQVFCESGARPGVYGLLVKCCAMSLSERS